MTLQKKEHILNSCLHVYKLVLFFPLNLGVPNIKEYKEGEIIPNFRYNSILSPNHADPTCFCCCFHCCFWPELPRINFCFTNRNLAHFCYLNEYVLFHIITN